MPNECRPDAIQELQSMRERMTRLENHLIAIEKLELQEMNTLPVSQIYRIAHSAWGGHPDWQKEVAEVLGTKE